MRHVPPHNRFNPRAPCGARPRTTPSRRHRRCFNPRAPCGARPAALGLRHSGLQVSIHAPRAGRDLPAPTVCVSTCPFQSTRPVRGATPPCRRRPPRRRSFNPRAPCGARRSSNLRPGARARFNPRAPCGARPWAATSRGAPTSFNPRAPCGARRDRAARDRDGHQVSIHAPRAGRDGLASVLLGQVVRVSIHAPRAGRDRAERLPGLRQAVSIHAPRAGRDDTTMTAAFAKYAGFNPRAPCGARPRRSGRRFSRGRGFNPRAPCGARRTGRAPAS